MQLAFSRWADGRDNAAYGVLIAFNFTLMRYLRYRTQDVLVSAYTLCNITHYVLLLLQL